MALATNHHASKQLDEMALAIVRKASRDRRYLSLEAESRRLLNLVPDSGMSRHEVSDLIARSAMGKQVAVMFG